MLMRVEFVGQKASERVEGCFMFEEITNTIKPFIKRLF